MKTIKSLSAILIITVVVSACAQKMSFMPSTIVPAATGQVEVKKDRNSNYGITINVLNLAKPQRLSPSKETYVVWMETDRKAAQKVGQINPATGLFSKALKGSLSTTSVTEPTRIFISAEDNIDVQYPTGQVVLTTSER
ncbi:hypothetical protein [Fibrella forsythiae]|uniref:Uncharacterized protein n=1 Tax=Fibrella forsythiae TaxID=2817061 RepID=A0ABS3JLY4_9BACT|nr:hypothetical protein [Fibrella forsythiae]MBO0951024.1 hypothetical protein [Fibrella forsythiae]